MKDHDVFWELEALSDRQLLERVGLMLGSSRRLMAELIAHLGEVEERRLHLVAACSSMFAYCLKLGMTEDEAYRRIEVARLARRYPAMFPLLANGQLSISVVALLKHYLSDENHLELLASAAGKTVAQTRELIAARFPRPDVPSSVRKLPERHTMMQPPLALSKQTESSATGTDRTAGETRPDDVLPSFTSNVTEPRFAAGGTSSTALPAPADIARKGSSMSFAPAVDATRATSPEKPPPTHPPAARRTTSSVIPRRAALRPTLQGPIYGQRRARAEARARQGLAASLASCRGARADCRTSFGPAHREPDAATFWQAQAVEPEAVS